jgi:hypothetical protein
VRDHKVDESKTEETYLDLTVGDLADWLDSGLSVHANGGDENSSGETHVDGSSVRVRVVGMGCWYGMLVVWGYGKSTWMGMWVEERQMVRGS